MDPIDILMDENNSENIILYGEDGEAIECEQIAVIELDGITYALLHPLDAEGLADDEALVFAVDESGDDPMLRLEDNEDIIDAVFTEYYILLNEYEEDQEDDE